jgi:hypothetical protein
LFNVRGLTPVLIAARVNYKHAIRSSVSWNKTLNSFTRNGSYGIIKRHQFDFNLANQLTGMTALHYCAEYPSLSVIIELLSLKGINVIALDNCLRVPCQLIPLSHLTSKKSLLIYEKEQMFRHLFAAADIFESSSDKYKRSDKPFPLDIPAEKSFDFDLDETDNQLSTQRLRCIPVKSSLLTRGKLPSERMIGRGTALSNSKLLEGEIMFKKKGEMSLQKLGSFHLPISLAKIPNTSMLNKKPLRISLKTTPALQANDLQAFNKTFLNKGKLLESSIGRICTVADIDEGIA